MDLRPFRYFLAVAEHRSFSAAANVLRVAQPTLSRQIGALEADFGARLFIRHGRGVDLTDPGILLRDRLTGVVRQLSLLKDEVSAAAQEPVGEVAFGLPPSVRSLLAVPLLTRFAAAWPNIRVNLTEDTSGRLRDLVADGALDLAITNRMEPMRGLHTELLATEGLFLAGPKTAKLALRQPTSFAFMADKPLILTAAPNSLRMLVEQGLARIGCHPRVALEINSLPLMTDMVVQGLGYTVLPYCGLIAELKRGRISAAPLEDTKLTWVVARPTSRPLSEGAKRFAGEIFAEVAHLVSSGVWKFAEAHARGPGGGA